MLIIPAFGTIGILSGITQIIIFGNQSMIFDMRCICALRIVVRGRHMYTFGIESDKSAYTASITMTISLPTGTKILKSLIGDVHVYFSMDFPFFLLFCRDRFSDFRLNRAVVTINPLLRIYVLKRTIFGTNTPANRHVALTRRHQLGSIRVAKLRSGA